MEDGESHSHFPSITSYVSTIEVEQLVLRFFGTAREVRAFDGVGYSGNFPSTCILLSHPLILQTSILDKQKSDLSSFLFAFKINM